MTASLEQESSARLHRPVVLVGLMGAGKTSVGRRLADALGVTFHDSDHEIEAAAGMEIREIFERFGEPYFRDGEVRVIARLLDSAPGILATGGGAFMSDKVREMIAASAVSVWLNGDLETLWSRVKDKPTRPLLQQPEPKAVLAGLIETRYPTYAKADVQVPTEAGVPHEEMVARIIAALRAYDAAHPEKDPVFA